jgi:predicted glycoside hydrolase/deacetylase ChbG (UPF0249 family)
MQRMPTPLSRVILHADDFGYSIDTTLSIRRCIDRGVITSTTVMANMPATDAALKHALQVQPGISVGVHLNLCEGRPLTRATSLVDRTGSFRGKRSVTVRALLHQLNSDDIERECSAQIARVIEAGVRVSHIDGHKHLHLLPGIASVVARVALAFGITRVRCPRGIAWRPHRLANGLAPLRLAAATLADHRFTAAGLVHPDRLVDIRDLVAAREQHDRVALMTTPSLLTEVMCHPGQPPRSDRPVRSSSSSSEEDFLLGADFAALLDAARLQRCTYWDC